jgi:ERCC4-related helicase
MMDIPNPCSIWPEHLTQLIQGLFISFTTFPRFEKLMNILIQKLDSHDSFRGIVFVRQRVTTHIIQYFVSSNSLLQHRLTSACIYASTSPATSSLSVTKNQVQVRINDFSKGTINLLISTVVAEEGMDVPAANCVIRFDPMLNGVSYVQGRGRARQSDSSFVVMKEQSGRDVATLAQVEAQQQVIVSTFEPVDSHFLWEKNKCAQQSREHTAASILLKPVDRTTVLSLLHQYVQKTKGNLNDVYTTTTIDVECVIMYDSILRKHTVGGKGVIRRVPRQLQHLHCSTSSPRLTVKVRLG